MEHPRSVRLPQPVGKISTPNKWGRRSPQNKSWDLTPGFFSFSWWDPAPDFSSAALYLMGQGTKGCPIFCCWCSDGSLALSWSFPWSCCVSASINSLWRSNLGSNLPNLGLNVDGLFLWDLQAALGVFLCKAKSWTQGSSWVLSLKGKSLTFPPGWVKILGERGFAQHHWGAQ